MPEWSIRWTSEALRSLQKIPPRVVPAILEFVSGRLADNPKRHTHELHAPFAGKRSGSVGSYRVLISLDEATLEIIIHRVGYHGNVYQPR